MKRITLEVSDEKAATILSLVDGECRSMSMETIEAPAKPKLTRKFKGREPAIRLRLRSELPKFLEAHKGRMFYVRELAAALESSTGSVRNILEELLQRKIVCKNGPLYGLESK